MAAGKVQGWAGAVLGKVAAQRGAALGKAGVVAALVCRQGGGKGC